MKLAFYKVNEDTEELEPIGFGKLDGYAFGDRLLEGVMFVYFINEDGGIQVKIDDASKKYFETLNKKKWITEALKYVIQSSPNDHIDFSGNTIFDEVILYDHDKPWNDQPYALFFEEPTFVTK